MGAALSHVEPLVTLAELPALREAGRERREHEFEAGTVIIDRVPDGITVGDLVRVRMTGAFVSGRVTELLDVSTVRIEVAP